MFSGTENTYDVPPAEPVQTNPDCNVNVDVEVVGCAVNETTALDAVLDLGTYPMFLAKETTFSLTVAESKKDSFTTIFELNAVI
jgi:hypothetical protein